MWCKHQFWLVCGKRFSCRLPCTFNPFLAASWSVWIKPRSHLADLTADLSRPWWSGEVLWSRREVGKERGWALKGPESSVNLVEVSPTVSDCYTPAQRSWRGGILDSPCPSVRPSVCRRHGFRSISQVCFGISISNFICMLMVAIGKSLLIFSDVTFEMAAWRPYWIFWFPDSNFTLALNINFKLQRHNTYVYG